MKLLFAFKKIVSDSWVGTWLSTEPCDHMVFHQENSYKHVILCSHPIKYVRTCCIKKTLYLIGPLPVQLCKILFMKMARCFNFQMFLLYTLISTLLPFLIHYVLTCLLLREGSFTCGAELERGRIPTHCLLEF